MISLQGLAVLRAIIYAEAIKIWWEHREDEKMKTYNDIIQFIDYLINSISNGKYIYYQISYIPPEKVDEEFLAKLELKVREKYQTDKNKSERLNLRRKKKARFLACRYKNILIILKTKGDTDIAQNEKWEDIRKEKIQLKISEYTTYLIGLGASKKVREKHKTLESKVSVTLGRTTYDLIKLSCLEAIREKKSIPLLMWEWNKINGFNGWSGINKQKLQLKEYLVIEVCKSFGIKKKEAKKLFRVNTFKAKSLKTKENNDIGPEEGATNNKSSPNVARSNN